MKKPESGTEPSQDTASLSADDSSRSAESADSKGQLSLLGDSPVHQFRKPVAICTLTNDALRDALQQEATHNELLAGILIGGLHTENLGIEQIIAYTLENPNIRFIILCGTDGRKAVGHMPGQSFLALAKNGIDEKGRMIGAEGKRPVIQNLSAEAIEHFRQNVTVIDLVENNDIATILKTVAQCIEQNPGLAKPFQATTPDKNIPIEPGYVPDKMVTDPKGYFVIYLNFDRNVIVMEHYTPQGVLNRVFEGETGASLYHPATEHGLVSRLDHAAYLGRELERAEHALKTGQDYIQDAGQ